MGSIALSIKYIMDKIQRNVCSAIGESSRVVLYVSNGEVNSFQLNAVVQSIGQFTHR